VVLHLRGKTIEQERVHAEEIINKTVNDKEEDEPRIKRRDDL
jgi:hypothetical protein